MSTKTKAYSYLRISTDQQKVGDGVRRQMEASKAYAEEHGYELVDEIQDIGVSAFKGKNSSEGALAAFIAGMEAGKIEPGSVLLVENLDRLSRDTVLEAFSQFTNILKNGVEIVTLTDQQHYTAKSVNENIGQLFMSMGAMLRAHEESVIKSKRVGAAWKRKREVIGEKILTKNVPSWITVSEDGKKMSIDKTSARTIKYIFKLALDGMGAFSIAQQLNADLTKYPTMTKAKKWEVSFVQYMLKSPSVYGALQLHQMVDGKRVPIGDLIEDYYPSVITKDTYNLVQAHRSTRSLGGRKTGGRKGKTVSNLFSGLVTCGHCGGKVIAHRRYRNSVDGVSYLRCDESKYKRGCEAGAWGMKEFETAFMKLVQEVSFQELFDETDDQEKRQELEGKIATATLTLEERNRALNNLINNFSADDMPPSLRTKLIERSREVESEIEGIKADIAAMNDQLSELSSANLAQEQQTLIEKFEELLKTNSDTKLREIRYGMQSLISKNVEQITLFNDFKIDPWDADELISDKLRSELLANPKFKSIRDIEKFFETQIGQRKFVESERYFSVRFKSGANRIVQPYENKTYVNISERMAKLRRGS